MDLSASTSCSNVKYDWYQTDGKVVLTILIKNVTQEKFVINFEMERVVVRVELPNSEMYTLNLNLSNDIIPAKCTYKLLSSKVEIHMYKHHSGWWESLEKKENSKKTEGSCKNWDAVTKQLTDDKEAESSVETLFSKIYSDGTDDQKRAMIKSFYESGGTVLSTNWNEVGKSTVEVKPPEGVEYKPWH